MTHQRGTHNPETQEAYEARCVLLNNSWRDDELAETVSLKPRNHATREVVEREYEGPVLELVVKHILCGEILTDKRGRGFYDRLSRGSLQK